ncbi:unnamed protein product [Hermetia illucens]|uniref:MADF domain-containing protein n=2 Tax=Hermetia illucens TaxID=343691 RepID=A0A7R8UBG9_HERIL|nr:unnamed protein product [Hermetia illucens]
MSETPRFIALVEQYECLWKKAYRNNLAARRKAWEEVAEKLYGCSWNTFSFSDKKAARSELQKKWKNIKDSFLKELRHQQHEKSGLANKKKAKYMFFDYLMFLIPEIDPRSRNRFPFINNSTESYPSSVEQDPMKDDNSCETYSYENACESPPPLSPEEKSTTAVARSTTVIRRRPTKSKITSVQFRSRLLKILSQQQNQKPNCAHDDDESFFHSLLPIVRKLDEQQKIQFRMEVLNSLRSARSFNNIPPQTAMNLGNLSNNQSYFPLSQHQLQIYSLPSTHTDLTNANGSHPQQNTNGVNVSNASQLEHVSLSNDLDSRKNQNVQVYSNVL